jgi:hypothetical protein
VQVSRLGMPLVNEVVIGLPDKDKFNASHPSGDAQFATYVTNPTLPTLLEVVLGIAGLAPTPPRDDLVLAFLQGVPMLNQPANVTASEMLRLNTGTGAPLTPKAAAQQSRLGVLGGDLAGFPNGRRVGDDVVDIALRVAIGALRADAMGMCPAGAGVFCNVPVTDQADSDPNDYPETFPYLNTPTPGSP